MFVMTTDFQSFWMLPELLILHKPGTKSDTYKTPKNTFELPVAILNRLKYFCKKILRKSSHSLKVFIYSHNHLTRAGRTIKWKWTFQLWRWSGIIGGNNFKTLSLIALLHLQWLCLSFDVSFTQWTGKAHTYRDLKSDHRLHLILWVASSSGCP